MNLRWLEALRAIMTLGTVTQAAEHLRITQPAVSRMLASLETEIGFKLFERAHGRLLPTEDCDQFYREVERLLAGVMDIATIARDIRERRGDRLRIVAMQSLAEGLLPEVLGAFVADHPDVRISVDIRGRRDVQYWMAGQQFDVGVAVLPIEHTALISDPFIESDLYLVMPHGHPLAAKTKVELADIQRERVIGLPETALLRHEIDQAMQRHVGPYNVMTETSSLHSACQLAAKGLGVTIADTFTVATFPTASFTARPLSAPIRRVYGFLFPARRARSSLTLDFANKTKTAAATLVQEMRGRVT